MPPNCSVVLPPVLSLNGELHQHADVWQLEVRVAVGVVHVRADAKIVEIAAVDVRRERAGDVGAVRGEIPSVSGNCSGPKKRRHRPVAAHRRDQVADAIRRRRPIEAREKRHVVREPVVRHRGARQRNAHAAQRREQARDRVLRHAHALQDEWIARAERLEVAALATHLEREVVEQLVEHDRPGRGGADLRIGVRRAERAADGVGRLERGRVECDVRKPRREVAARSDRQRQLSAAEAATRDVVRRRRHARSHEGVARNVAAAERHAVERDAVLVGREPGHRESGWTAVRVRHE